MKKTNKTTARKTAAAKSWEARRNDVLAMARAKLSARCKAGRDALSGVLPEKLVRAMLNRAIHNRDMEFVAPVGYTLVFKDDAVDIIRSDAKPKRGWIPQISANIGGESLTKAGLANALRVFFG